MTQKQSSIKRWNPLLGEWTIFAPVTDTRPWSGAVLSGAKTELPAHDPGCYLCPGVQRAGGKINPPYTGVHVFNNDFASLSPESLGDENNKSGIEAPAGGICRVVCFSPTHNITLAEMEVPALEMVIQAFRREFQELSSTPGIEYVMMFENKGKAIGVSNPHPHGQIYSTDFVPKIPQLMYNNLSRHKEKEGSCLMCEILASELSKEERIISQNQHFAAFIPFYARYKYEINIVPKRHEPFITGLSSEEMRSLSTIYSEVLARYDNLFMMPFPNITIFYNAPCKKGLDPSPWHFHIAFYPPMRNADKLKYLAGFETGSGNIINPSLPRNSAEELRKIPAVHYSKETKLLP